jgi:glutaredoxin 3
MMNKINNSKEDCFIFYKNSCSYCLKAKAALESINIIYDCSEIKSEEEKNNLVKLTNHKTFPQIFIKKQFIGGYNELMVLIMTNKIYEMLQICPDF